MLGNFEIKFKAVFCYKLKSLLCVVIHSCTPGMGGVSEMFSKEYFSH